MRHDRKTCGKEKKCLVCLHTEIKIQRRTKSPKTETTSFCSPPETFLRRSKNIRLDLNHICSPSNLSFSLGQDVSLHDLEIYDIPPRSLSFLPCRNRKTREGREKERERDVLSISPRKIKKEEDTHR